MSYADKMKILGLCECGCGKSTPLAKRTDSQKGFIKDSPIRFIQGHNRNKHGKCGTQIYNIWVSMKQRCLNKNRECFKNYGGRGIKVCERWHIFENFLADMGEPPTPEHSIDRINNDGNYEPGNCRWATAKEQQNNTRRSLCLITYKGEIKTIKNWSECLKISYSTLKMRLSRGWPIDKAFQ